MQLARLAQDLNSLPSIIPALVFGVNRDFKPMPDTAAITTLDALAPIVTFYAALLLLFPSPRGSSIPIRTIRMALALTSAYLFLALPYRFHVSGSAIFSYQLGLVGWYGGPRVLDLFVISNTVPKRIKHVDGQAASLPATTSFTERRKIEPSFAEGVDHTSGVRLSEPEEVPVEQTMEARFLWALDLLTAMRGCGWDFCSADVRHSTRSWHPPPADRTYALFAYILPSCVGGASVMRHVWYAITDAANVKASSPSDVINYSLLILPLHVRLLGVAAAGVTLYTLFDASYTIAAILLSFPAHYKRDKLTEASSTNNIATAPPLNPLAATEARSIRGFWSKTWHRLFARLFLIWGARPGEVVAKALGSKSGDWGKVLGAFAASAVVHGQAERAALGARSMERYNFFGIPLPLGGEPLFFMLSAVGILIEEAVKRPILARRKRRLLLAKAGSEEADAGMERWYDRPIGYLWTIGFLLTTGQFFLQGWSRSGIWKELTMSVPR